MEISRSTVLSIDELREQLICPITYEIMRNPVVASDGQTYEAESIRLWIQQCKAMGNRPTSPMTGDFLPNENLTKNAALLPFLDRLRSLSQPATKSTASAAATLSKTSPAPIGTETLTSKVFEELDRVMNLDLVKSLGLRCAQVVVVGMESHGKSTLLERLIGLPVFPKNRSRCTTCPIRVQLRRNPRQITTICIRRRDTLEEHAPSKSIIAMENICTDVNRLMNWIITTLEPRVLVSMQYEIVICIQQPFVPNLDVLDLPGLVGANIPNSGAQQDLVKATAELANSVITKEKDRSVFLLVVDCRTQTNHSIATELISTGGVEAQTVGVLTKLDMYRSEEEDVDPASDPLLQKLVGNKDLLTTHGWLLCSNRTPARAEYKQDIDRLEVMETKEKQLLARDYAVYARTGRVGLPAIRRAVQKLFEDFLCHEWIPSITNRLLEESNKLMDAHVACGLPIPNNTSGINVRNKIVQALNGLPPSMFLARGSPKSVLDFEVIPHESLTSTVVATMGRNTSQWVRLDRAREVWNAMDAFNGLVSTIEDKIGTGQNTFYSTSYDDNVVNKAVGPSCGIAKGAPGKVQLGDDFVPKLCCARQVVREKVVPMLETLINAIHDFMTSPLLPQLFQTAAGNDSMSITSEAAGSKPALLQFEVKNNFEMPTIYTLTKAQFHALVSSTMNVVVTKLGKLPKADFDRLQCAARTIRQTQHYGIENDLTRLVIANTLTITQLQLEWLLQMLVKQCGSNIITVVQNSGYRAPTENHTGYLPYYPQYATYFTVSPELLQDVQCLVEHMKSNDTIVAYTTANKVALTDALLGQYVDAQILKIQANPQIANTTKNEVVSTANSHKMPIKTVPRVGKVNLNCGRFPKLVKAIQTHITASLGDLASAFRDECLADIRDLADREHGFLVTNHGLSDRGTYGFQLEWTFEGRNMAKKIISKWLYVIEHGISEKLKDLNLDEIDIDKQESCAEARKTILQKILNAVEVVASLNQIKGSTPVTVFGAMKTHGR